MLGRLGLKFQERVTLKKMCSKLGIVVPPFASNKQIETAYESYRQNAAVVKINGELDVIQTNDSVNEYIVSVSLTQSIIIRAENEETACDWIRYTIMPSFIPYIGEMEENWCEINDIEKVNAN